MPEKMVHSKGKCKVLKNKTTAQSAFHVKWNQGSSCLYINLTKQSNLTRTKFINKINMFSYISQCGTASYLFTPGETN